MNYLSCVNCLFISVLNCLIASLWRIAHYQLQRGRRSLREIWMVRCVTVREWESSDAEEALAAKRERERKSKKRWWQRGGEREKIAGRWLYSSEEIRACWKHNLLIASRFADVCVHICLSPAYVNALLMYVYRGGVVISGMPPHPPHIHTHPTSLTAICPVINLTDTLCSIDCLTALHQITVCVCVCVFACMRLYVRVFVCLSTCLSFCWHALTTS